MLIFCSPLVFVLAINIDALLYIQITDPVKSAYEIAHLPMAVSQLAQTSLLNVIGEMDLDETLASVGHRLLCRLGEQHRLANVARPVQRAPFLTG